MTISIINALLATAIWLVGCGVTAYIFGWCFTMGAADSRKKEVSRIQAAIERGRT